MSLNRRWWPRVALLVACSVLPGTVIFLCAPRASANTTTKCRYLVTSIIYRNCSPQPQWGSTAPEYFCCECVTDPEFGLCAATKYLVFSDTCYVVGTYANGACVNCTPTYQHAPCVP